jgi:hypothetical protein
MAQSQPCQYKFIEQDYSDPQRQLEANKLGMDGWELVSTFVIGSTIHMVFKKPGIGST